ncbi:hypothetical protein KAR34_12585 [bacterium]|nr:hypothetical protein [bacterium]
MNKYRIVVDLETRLKTNFEHIFKNGNVIITIPNQNNQNGVLQIYLDFEAKSSDETQKIIDGDLLDWLQSVSFILSFPIQIKAIRFIIKSEPGKAMRHGIEMSYSKNPRYIFLTNISDIEKTWGQKKEELFYLWLANNSTTSVDAFRNLWLECERIVGKDQKEILCDECKKIKLCDKCKDKIKSYPRMDKKKMQKMVGRLFGRANNLIRNGCFHYRDSSKRIKVVDALNKKKSNEDESLLCKLFEIVDAKISDQLSVNVRGNEERNYRFRPEQIYFSYIPQNPDEDISVDFSIKETVFKLPDDF